jgi:hypothetical protein
MMGFQLAFASLMFDQEEKEGEKGDLSYTGSQI